MKGLCEKFDGDVYLTARDEGRGLAAVKSLNEVISGFALCVYLPSLGTDPERNYLREVGGGISRGTFFGTLCSLQMVIKRTPDVTNVYPLFSWDTSRNSIYWTSQSRRLWKNYEITCWKNMAVSMF